jgi:ribonuclease R
LWAAIELAVRIPALSVIYTIVSQGKSRNRHSAGHHPQRQSAAPSAQPKQQQQPEGSRQGPREGQKKFTGSPKPDAQRGLRGPQRQGKPQGPRSGQPARQAQAERPAQSYQERDEAVKAGPRAPEARKPSADAPRGERPKQARPDERGQRGSRTGQAPRENQPQPKRGQTGKPEVRGGRPAERPEARSGGGAASGRAGAPPNRGGRDGQPSQQRAGGGRPEKREPRGGRNERNDRGSRSGERGSSGGDRGGRGGAGKAEGFARKAAPKGPIIGKLTFNMRGGGARLLAAGDVLLAWIGQGDTGTGLHGDKVEAVATRGDMARVVRVIERARTAIVGTLQMERGQQYLVPDDPRVPYNLLVTPGTGDFERPPHTGDKVVVQMGEWTDASVPPSGPIIELLGAAGEAGVDMLGIIRAYNLATEFPEAPVREAEEFPEKIPPEEIACREDCRGQMVLTIDPDDAKDHDDAVTVEKLADGWRLTVHIADVAHFVRPGTALDVEAKSRGNSTYLVDRVIPMLPLELSADLCSLRAGVDRLAHAAFLEFTEDGKVRGARFGKTVIRVHTRLTYKHAYTLLQNGTVPKVAPEVGEQVRLAWELASKLRTLRFAHGSLDLDFPEVKVYLDADGRADRIEKVEHDESHQLVEEFMLAANEAVAHEIKNRPAPCIYRIHEKPDDSRLQDFRKLAATAGLRVGDLSQRKEVARMLMAIRGRPDEFRLKLEFLKSLRRAAYSPDPVGHYGLAKADYLHFTSPIRRYADLVAHRVLAYEPVGGRKELTEVAEHLSETERNSASAEMDSVLIKKMEFFQRQLDAENPQIFQATVREAKANGLLIEVAAVDMTGMIPTSSVPGGPYFFESARARLFNRRTGQAYGPGDTLEVRVDRVDAEKRLVDFIPTETNKPAAPIEREDPPLSASESPRRPTPMARVAGAGNARRNAPANRRRR